jgi:pimeloyl-ACP methyl ester carboxylesterase
MQTHTQPEPFKISVPDDEIMDLRTRLASTRWPGDFANDDWRYGTKESWLKDIVSYWINDYDWRSVEAEMNSYPQFKVEIDGIAIHYMHVKGTGATSAPIILTHGWPWTFWDWREVVDRLTDPARFGGNPQDSFDVVVPSLPGFGFSTPLRKTGIAPRQVAQLWDTLMHDVLGYDSFFVAGGDWGSVISSEFGYAHPDHVLGTWMTFPHVPGVNVYGLDASDFAADEQWMFENHLLAAPTIAPHVSVASREPQTAAVAFNDSPAGLAAWLWERRRLWGNYDEDLLETFDRDFLCTLASMYWFNNAIATSMRIYAEFVGPYAEPAPVLHNGDVAIKVPTGFAVFPKEIAFLPRKLAEKHTNLKRYTVHDSGGHFAVAEEPETVAREITEFVRPLRNTQPVGR